MPVSCHRLERNKCFQATFTKETLWLSPPKDLKAWGHRCGQLQTELWSIPDLISGLLVPRQWPTYITPVYLLFKNVCFLFPNFFILLFPKDDRCQSQLDRWSQWKPARLNDWSLGVLWLLLRKEDLGIKTDGCWLRSQRFYIFGFSLVMLLASKISNSCRFWANSSWFSLGFTISFFKKKIVWLQFWGTENGDIYLKPLPSRQECFID